MGSSGGGARYRTGVDADRLRQRVLESQEETRRLALEGEVNELLERELTALNDRDAEAVRRRLEEIQEAIGEGLVDVERLVFGGSVSRHTYCNDLSDVDALVLLDREVARELTPAMLLRDFAERLGASLTDVEVTVGALAVTVTYRDGTEVQLLPAFRDGERFVIGSEDGQRWRRIDPRRFASALSEANAALGGGLVPTVKLAKAIIETYPEKRRVEGFHVEALALEVFRGYDGPKTPKAMLTHFFAHAAERVRTPLPDVTDQSAQVDEYLGAAGSLDRSLVGDSLSRTARRMEHAQGIEDWRSILGEE